MCRAGAMTVAELAVAGVPSILVPLPGAPGDHQTANARVLERVGASVLLPDAECDAGTLADRLDRLLDDPSALEAMGRAGGIGGPARRRRRRRPGGRGQCPAGRRGGVVVSDAAGTGPLGDPGRPVTVHVVGIGGAGMSAIATALQAMGHTVTGSDLKASAVTERLRRAGIPVAIGHAAANVGAADVVTVSSAIPEDNPEIVEARRRGITVLPRAEALASIASLKRCLAVAGTHGKTTTASMLALQLVEGGTRAVVPHRRGRQRDRHQRRVGRGGVAGGRGRRERRHRSWR